MVPAWNTDPTDPKLAHKHVISSGWDGWSEALTNLMKDDQVARAIKMARAGLDQPAHHPAREHGGRGRDRQVDADRDGERLEIE